MSKWDMNNPIIYGLISIALLIAAYFVNRYFQTRKESLSIKRDQDKVYQWLMNSIREKPDLKYRTTKAISSGTHLPEERIREVAIIDERIHKSTGNRDDVWTVKNMPLV